MSTNQPKPIFSVAQEFNISTQTIRNTLLKEGFQLPKRLNFKITPEMYSVLIQNFGDDNQSSNRKNEIQGSHSVNRDDLKKSKANKRLKSKVPKRSFIVNGYDVDVYTEYYPKSGYNALSKKNKKDRKLIYNFKKGEWDTKHVKILSDLISRNFNKPFHNVLLCCIPASTVVKTNIRFKQYFIEVTNKLKILNGYGAITRIKDRESMQKVGREINRTDGVMFKKEPLEGRDIILFDDVITTGDSFTEFTRELSKFDVKSIYGVMLGKTFHSKKG